MKAWLLKKLGGVPAWQLDLAEKWVKEACDYVEELTRENAVLKKQIENVVDENIETESLKRELKTWKARAMRAESRLKGRKK